MYVQDTDKAWGFKEIWNGSELHPRGNSTLGKKVPWNIYKEIFPNVRWIHLIRHPVEYARSSGAGHNGAVSKCGIWVKSLKYCRQLNKDPNYIYSKRIWYLDPENWQMNVQEMYDRQGRLWKSMEMFHNEYKMKEAEGMVTVYNGEHTVDLIRRHGSCGQYEIYAVGKTLNKKIFSVANLQQLTY